MSALSRRGTCGHCGRVFTLRNQDDVDELDRHAIDCQRGETIEDLRARLEILESPPSKAFSPMAWMLRRRR
jgi:hypothetical protein